MKFLETPLKGSFIIEPEPRRDERGMFARVFCKKEFEYAKLNKEIVQVNHSLTKEKGTVRGMHYQKPPNAEIKMVRCIKGSVFDIIIDLRKNSPTFLNWFGEVLSSDNMKIMYVPEGFAHGMQALETNSEILYFVTEFYAPKQEGGVNCKDPKIGIKWPLEPRNLSEKDKKLPFLTNFEGIDI